MAFNPKDGTGKIFRFSEQEKLTSLCTLLFLIVLLAFGPTLNNGFVNYDDPVYITSNTHVQQGFTWENIKWAFRPTQETANWHPLTWLSHMLDCQFFGLRPFGHHLTNILFHATNSLMLFLVLRKITGAM